jgi:[ribosomal protein S5]-alanine N-acetyltransferase
MALEPIARIDAQRVFLRPVQAVDLADLLAVNGDPEVTRFLPYATWESIADGERWLGRMTTLVASGTAHQWVVVRELDHKVIGSVLLFKYDETSKRIELGYVLAHSAWGQGFMQEAVSAACQYAFDTMGIRRIEAEVNPDNHASCSFMLRLGFRLEGLLRQRWFAKGQAYDTHMYGLLAEDRLPGAE